MVVVNPTGNKQYFLDGFVQKILDSWITWVKHDDWDFMCIIDGEVGAGKSTFAQQMAAYVDPTFNIDRVCFSPQELKDACMKAEKYQAIIWDEALLGAQSDDWAGQINRLMRKMFGLIRQKNLFIFLCIPSFFDLHSNYAIHRSKVLFRTYVVLEQKRRRRGQWKVWTKEGKELLYWRYKINRNKEAIKPKMYGRFARDYVVDEAEYRKKKNDTMLQAMKDDDKAKEPKHITRLRNNFLTAMEQLRKEGYTLKEQAQWYGVHKETLTSLRMDYGGVSKNSQSAEATIKPTANPHVPQLDTKNKDKKQSYTQNSNAGGIDDWGGLE